MTFHGDPSKELPRDGTGSYLHLKLKRFSSVKDLTMPYARKTWHENPHHAEVNISSSRRSSCRQCHSAINKGELRMRLWLQCHKGCKNSAYFHEECFWKYPETIKLEDIAELMGLSALPEEHQSRVRRDFKKLKKGANTEESHSFEKTRPPKEQRIVEEQSKRAS